VMEDNPTTRRGRTVSSLALFILLTSTPAVAAQHASVLWRHYVAINGPDIDDTRMWRAQPGTKTRSQCESEVKENQFVDPGRGYRMEYHCFPDTVDPRGPKGK
jgi:hypothetical protein